MLIILGENLLVFERSELETLRLIGEFLEVAFNQILYLRNVYPADLFEQRKKFNVEVMASRHPVLTSYIGEVISQSMEEVVKGLAKKLILAVQDNSVMPHRPREHFVFNLQYLVDPITTFENEADRDIRPIAAYGSKADAELHIRAFLIKLNSCNAHLGDPIKQDLTWTTFLELNDTTKEPLSEHSKKNDRPPQWIPCDNPAVSRQEDQTDFPTTSLPAAAPSKRLIPLKSQGLGMIQLQMMIIQHNEKNDHEQTVATPH
ncbi:hypothetical protein PGT21_029574 [Puccinia graminis f. sp. tritici]|uniref:HORMA domain-containing protein n=1 Tax=Puccinia graminis f. sp. tritici TaxID=56615 RepID=A0A5B0QXH4_PUCGR|nr:hypothetical protein PGT21_027369 [Puccinia graminis f. sp. tritici]KAA1118007.1 hypothetical protein PGT21_029574 [Puccinia graminis f. sp. tritici]KAA1127694.1 hypothetical protein PGTUg99_001200 [Puccinia graminis f. sp. tritici]